MKGLYRATSLAVAAQACLALSALRHHFVWGAGRSFAGYELSDLLGLGEGLGLVAFTVLGALALWQACAAAPTAGHAPATVRSVLAAGTVVAIAAALVPPFLSSDVFDYIARGRVEVHYGRNPYLTPPAALPATDPVLALAQWPGFVMPYGPISALAQAACAALGGGVPWLGVYAYKLLAGAAHVATGWLLCRAASPVQGPRVLALWLFHPFVLLETCGSAHNEALVALFLALALERAVRDRFAAATLAFALAVLTKHGGAPLGPLLLVLAWRRGRMGSAALGLGAAAVVTALLAWRYFLAPGALDFLRAQTDNRSTSLQHFATLLLGPQWQRPLLWSGYAVAIVAVSVAVGTIRDLHGFARRGVTTMVTFVLLAMPLFSPWYHLWWAPLVALLPSRDRGVAALRLLAWLGPLSYLVYASTRRLDLVHQAFAWTLACAVPAAVALSPKRREPEP